MRLGKPLRAAGAAILAFATTAPLLATPAAAQFRSARAKAEEKQAQIPTCARNLGALAVQQPKNNWWNGLGLESPEAVLKILVSQSGCFSIVDRGAGFEMAQQERALSAAGQLQQGANLGGGQIVAAKYILVPDLVSKDDGGSGVNIGASLGGLVGGGLGFLAPSAKISNSSAQVSLAMTNVQTSVQEAMTQGNGSKTDVGLGLGVGGFFGGAFGGLGVSSYQKSPMGQVIVLAYIDAYTKLVTQMGGLSIATGEGAAPAQTLTMSRPGRMYAAADDASASVRDLRPGMALYPTGNKNGIWVEVSDEIGNKGWVPQTAIENAK